MKLLVLQETDWIKRGPHQQHHLMDRMALRGHEIHVIDYEYLWREDKEKKIITGRKEIKHAYKIFKDADITLIRLRRGNGQEVVISPEEESIFIQVLLNRSDCNVDKIFKEVEGKLNEEFEPVKNILIDYGINIKSIQFLVTKA